MSTEWKTKCTDRERGPKGAERGRKGPKGDRPIGGSAGRPCENPMVSYEHRAKNVQYWQKQVNNADDVYNNAVTRTVPTENERGTTTMCMKEMAENEYIRMMQLVGVEYTKEDMDARCIPTNTTSRKVMEMYCQLIRCYRNKIHTKLHCAQEKNDETHVVRCVY